MNRVALDIETIPRICAAGDVPAELTQDEAKKAALDALTGQIVCVGLLAVNKSQRIESGLAIVAKDEKQLLTSLWSHLADTKCSQFIAHNGLVFDLPYLWRRSVVHGVRPTVNLDLRRYRNDFLFDTMSVWGNWDSRSNASLDALANGLGIGAKSGSGGKVLELWKAGKLEEIARYCIHDC